MKSTEHWLIHDHTQMETFLTRCKKEAEINDWWALERCLDDLVGLLKHHMAQEEEIIFPAYDEKSPSSSGLTAELLAEHDQIVDCVRDLRATIDNKDEALINSRIDKLVNLLLKHDNKEEEMLIPFASHLLFEDRDELSEKLENFVTSSQSRVW